MHPRTRYLVVLFVRSALASGTFATAGCEQAPPCSATLSQSAGVEVRGNSASAAVVEVPRFVRSIIPTDPSKYPYNHVASISELPNGDLLIVWGAGSRELGEDTVIVMSRRRIGESTWSPPVVVADRPGFADANPVLFVDDRGVVRLYYVEMFGDTFCLGTVKQRISDNQGRSWSKPDTALDAICVMVRNRPIVTRRGRWVLPAYIQGIYASQFWISDDDGASWQPTSPILKYPSTTLQPAVVELEDGTLYSLMRRSGKGGFTWEGRSSDCGLTWSMRPREDLPNPDSGVDVIRLASGELVVAYNDSPSDRTKLAVAVSRNGGETWSRPKTIEAGDGEFSYPSLIQAADGTIHIVYTHRRTAIAHAEFNPAWLLAP